MSKANTTIMQVISEIKRMPFTEQNKSILIRKLNEVYIQSEKEVIIKAYSDALQTKGVGLVDSLDLAESYYVDNYRDIH